MRDPRSAGSLPAPTTPRRKVDPTDITQALAEIGQEARYNQLRDRRMTATECSKRTAQLAISQACREGGIVHSDGQYRLPL